jgi:hypothetical protein
MLGAKFWKVTAALLLISLIAVTRRAKNRQ